MLRDRHAHGDQCKHNNPAPRNTAMKAKTFAKQIMTTLRPPTPRKVLNAARKYHLRDTRNELGTWIGDLTSDQRCEFETDTDSYAE